MLKLPASKPNVLFCRKARDHQLKRSAIFHLCTTSLDRHLRGKIPSSPSPSAPDHHALLRQLKRSEASSSPGHLKLHKCQKGPSAMLIQQQDLYLYLPCEMSLGLGVRNTAQFSEQSSSITIWCGLSH